MPESIALNCDCMEYMRSLPDKAFDVVVADPPYNIAKAAWDKWPSVDAYVSDVMAWLREFSRIAAYCLGFDFVGCEIDKTYFDLEEKRFETFTSQQSLFY